MGQIGVQQTISPISPIRPISVSESKPSSTSGGAASAATKPAAPMRRFGRFELRQLLGKSTRSMLWLVFDAKLDQELMLCMPRVAPNSASATEHWIKTANAGARVVHPNLAHVVEVGQVEKWPYMAYDRALGETLDERLARQPTPLPVEIADWVCQYLEGLAFAHEAGLAHRDVQCATMIIGPTNQVRVLGLEVAQEVFAANADYNSVTRRAVRDSAAEDVLCVGLMLHRLLSGRPVLEQTDLHLVVQQMQPTGHELVRLGWETPHPTPEPLRAICNRATDRQERQRYHIARSFLRALDGWRTSAGHDDEGPIALLIDKLQRIGHLPSTSTALQRVGQSSAMDRQHTSMVATQVMQDMALALELLRRVNNALKQHGAPVDGTVLNMQRAIAMLGLEGVSQAARALKPWPGPLNEVQAAMLQSLMKRVHRAGQIAQSLRPAGYDAEVVYLITVMQNLGRLLLQYHFPDDAQQIRQLMQPPEPTAEQPHPATLSEQGAAFAVMGCDLDSLGMAVAKHWSLGEELLQMMRRQSPTAALRASGHGKESDAEVLRLTCSLANELVDALMLPESKRVAGVELATKRYARTLGLGLKDIQQALNPEAPEPVDRGRAAFMPGSGEAPRASGLRNRLAAKAADEGGQNGGSPH